MSRRLGAIVKSPKYDPTNTAAAQYYQAYEMIITKYLTISGGPSNPNAVINTIHKVTDVFRLRHARLIYINSKKDT